LIAAAAAAGGSKSGISIREGKREQEVQSAKRSSSVKAGVIVFVFIVAS
jgi:hypothetical protein